MRRAYRGGWGCRKYPLAEGESVSAGRGDDCGERKLGSAANSMDGSPGREEQKQRDDQAEQSAYERRVLSHGSAAATIPQGLNNRSYAGRGERRLVAIGALGDLDGAAIAAARAITGTRCARREAGLALRCRASAAGTRCVNRTKVPVGTPATVGKTTDAVVVLAALFFRSGGVANPIAAISLANTYGFVSDDCTPPSQARGIGDAQFTKWDGVRCHTPDVANPADARIGICTQLTIRDRVFQHAPYRVTDAAFATGAVT
jgi:hypothetical protein